MSLLTELHWIRNPRAVLHRYDFLGAHDTNTYQGVTIHAFERRTQGRANDGQ